jgi:hypothetical protein
METRMIRSKLWLAIFASTLGANFPASLPAQSAAPAVEVTDLRTPHSPVFVLLGVEPSSIERPTNPKALGASLFSAVENGGNFAIEVAPYWLAPRPDLTFSKYYEAGVVETIEQTLAVSVASSTDLDSEDGSDDDETGVGASLRFSLWRGRPDPADVQKLAALDEELLDLFEKLQAQREEAPDDIAAIQALEDAIDAKVTEGDPVRRRIGESGHLGFSCDVAGGATGVFPSGHASDGEFARAGLWVTPAYRAANFLNAEVDVIAVARYMRDQQGENEDLGDLGGRLAVGFSDLLFSNDLALSLEFLHRFGLSDGESGDTSRVAGIIEYELPEAVQMGDAKYITATFGRDFDQPGDDDRLLLLFGLNFSFGANPHVPM